MIFGTACGCATRRKAQPIPAALPRDAIVSPQWLDHQLRTNPTRTVVLEASWAALSEARDYRAGHVPGAAHLNTDEFENGSPQWRLRPLADLQRGAGAHGIWTDSTVVVYGKQTIAAARVWWILGYSGVRDARVLNGGVEAWTRAGYGVETEVRRPVSRDFVADAREKMLASTSDVQELIERRDGALIDVRSRPEFDGRISGYTYIDAKGRLPDARFADNADDSARIYQIADGTLRDPEEIRKLWRAQGLLDDSGVPRVEWIFYCGSGWRSSLAYLYAHVLGFERIRNYSDGWSGWSTIYEPAPGHLGSTPGWLQRATGNPIEQTPP